MKGGLRAMTGLRQTTYMGVKVRGGVIINTGYQDNGNTVEFWCLGQRHLRSQTTNHGVHRLFYQLSYMLL